MSDRLLMIFVKNLIPGMVKTRIAEDIGIDKALDVYMELVHQTHKVSKKVSADKAVFYSEYVEIEDIWSNGDFEPKVQKGHTLGEKMSNAFDEAFDSYNKVVIIGSDCYELTTKIIHEAFEQLEEHDVVVGPAKDGGYYLLGMNAFFPQLFENKEYSTDRVFDELMEETQSLSLSCYQLPQLSDVDTVEDMKAAGLDPEMFDTALDDEESSMDEEAF
jgi:hypothetical protein